MTLLRRRTLLLSPLILAAGSASATPAPKCCALTFDDGPDPVQTARVLDRLKAHGQVPATFFLIGERLGPRTQPVLKRLLAEGHEVAHHSWRHGHMAPYTRAQVEADFRRAQAAIVRATGRQPRFFRPPFGEVSDTLYDATPLPFAGGIAAHDWLGGEPTARGRADRILNDPRLGDGAILLLHDVQPDPHPTPEALDLLIPALRAQGFAFLTLSALFARQRVVPRAGERRLWEVGPATES